MTIKQLRLYNELVENFSGEVFNDSIHRYIYATDASVYEQLPVLVCYPKTIRDLKELVRLARKYEISITPRTAGTSLAGQAIGDGIIADLSKHFTRIIAIDKTRKTVWVEPGVIRDVLNQTLRPYGLFYGPNTSTSNRCMIGGMVANNSSGTTSIKYGVTRDHVLRIKGILSNGEEVEFSPLSREELEDKRNLTTLEGTIYRQLHELLSNPTNKKIIKDAYPKHGIKRRNTGYALDALIEMQPYGDGPKLNLSKLIAGSEGTLLLITEVELALSNLPPEKVALICPHFENLKNALSAVPELMQFEPYALEMMDRKILACTIGHPHFENLRNWIVGDPYAVLMMELRADTKEALDIQINTVTQKLKTLGLDTAHPVRYAEEVDRAWTLRKAGLGLLGNLPGDAKAVACIEDTAVHVEDLKDYILELQEMIRAFDQDPVYFAHAGAGELHIRPVLNLKDPEDVKKFRAITEKTARLVKKYRGSLSGEHGDGRVRAGFIPIILGNEVYEMLRAIKHTWDPAVIFNRGKITDAPPMDESLRTTSGKVTPVYDTILDFEATGGIVRAAEKCNGSGDCRRTVQSGGLMCPSYMASLDEYQTTRARANLLRIILRKGSDEVWENEDLKAILDLCLSCKGCASECPSSVDITAIKAEFTQHYYEKHRRPLQDIILGHATGTFRLGSLFPALSNAMIQSKLIAPLIKKALHIHPDRSLPSFATKPFKIPRNNRILSLDKKHIWILADEFVRFHESALIKRLIKLCQVLGYTPQIAPVKDSGRSQLSKGFLKKAREIARENIDLLDGKISMHHPLIGIDPSAILGFRDEYPKLLRAQEREKAKSIGRFCYTFDEWLLREIKAGRADISAWKTLKKHILVHTHCHQKSLGLATDTTERLLTYLPDVNVQKIPSGCCGMAGSFGYDKDKFALSQAIGELVLFPAVRHADEHSLICSNGVSCRHQILDGTGRKAMHVIDILYEMIPVGNASLD